jgi:hypothetical protein
MASPNCFITALQESLQAGLHWYMLVYKDTQSTLITSTLLTMKTTIQRYVRLAVPVGILKRYNMPCNILPVSYRYALIMGYAGMNLFGREIWPFNLQYYPYYRVRYFMIVNTSKCSQDCRVMYMENTSKPISSLCGKRIPLV